MPPTYCRAIATVTALGLSTLAVTGVALASGPAAAAPSPKPSPNALAARSAASLVATHPAAIHASSDDSYVAHPVISTRDGLQYVPYDRTYKGLPVYGGDFVVTTDAAGKVLSTSVAQRAAIDLPTTAALTPAQAAGTARGRATSMVLDSVSAARKVVFALGGTPKLAYETVVSGHTGAIPSKLHVFTDAGSGSVLYSYDEVREGTGTAAYNGPNPVTISTSHPTSSTWTMTDPVRPGITCRSTTGGIFSGSDDVWGNGSAASLETACVDAKFDVEHEWSMLSAWLGRNGIDGSGGGFPITVGLNDVNAYWDGTQVAVGHNNAGNNIASQDVVGHEFGHAVDTYTPGGIGSAAVAEFTADVFGAMTEWYSNEPSAYDPPDYTVGEEVNLVGSGPIRYMYNPSLAGDPNCYSSTIPSTETHAAAGPGNHWFYLLAEGTNPTDGQPASATCNGSTGLVGIGIQTAGKIFYNAMLAKTTGMTYLQYRTATLNAAKNLTPGNCTNFNKVKAAWDAVSVPAQAGDPTCTASTITVTNPGAQTSTVGTADALQMAASGGTGSYTWSATGLPAGLSIAASTGRISGTPTTAGSYTSTVTARDTASAAGSVSFSWTVSATSPVVVTNPGAQTGYVGVNRTLIMSASGGTPPYTWSAVRLPPGKSIRATSGWILGAPDVAGTYNVRVTATDSTGAAGSVSFTWTINTGPFTVTNPGDQTSAVGIADKLTIDARGGTGPYTWKATGLPPGLTGPNGNGVVSGAPTTAGTYSVMVTATDAVGATGTVLFSWYVSPMQIADPGAQQWEIGVPVNLQMQLLADGTAPYTWSAARLPEGLTIDPATGLISGTPTRDSNDADVSVTDSAGVVATLRLVQTVVSAVQLRNVLGSPTLVVGQSYQRQMNVDTRTGSAPYTFSATGLPPGFSISTAGLISGTATTAGTYAVTVVVTDARGGTDSSSGSWTVTP